MKMMAMMTKVSVSCRPAATATCPCQVHVAATMKMMDEKDTASSSGKSSSRDNSAMEKLRKENASLNEKLGSTTKELEVVKNQAKGFEREHDRLLSQIQKLENQLDKNPSEAKKQK